MRAYTANMIPGGITPTINVSQYDNDYAVTVTLIEGAEIYTPPVGATIRVEGTKPDGHGFEYACTYQGNVVTMPIYTQMTVVSGRFPIELVVYQSGLRVGSCNIIFAVERAPLGEDTDISETVIPDIIAGAQAQADAAAASATSAATSATSAESAKVAAMDAAQDAIDAAQELQTAIQFNAALIHETASGAVASFSDGADDIPIQSVVAEITPVQSGSGDPSPSNIRPISGRTGMTVAHSGTNLLDGISWTSGVISANGVISTSTTSEFQYSGLIPVESGETYKFVYYNYVGANSRIHGYDASGTWVEQIGVFTGSGSHADTITIPSGVTQIRISTGKPYRTNIGLLSIASETTTIPITWQTQAGTVYGGTLNVTTGVLTVSGVLHTLTGNEDFSLATNSRRFQKTFSTLGWERANTVLSTQNQSNSVCSHATYLTGATVTATPANYRISADPNVDYANAIVFYDTQSEFANAAAFNAYLAEQYANGTPVQLYYDLATPPAPIQLSPTEIKTLLGGNTIYTDAGSVSVEYVADTKLYIDNKIAELQALVLENN